MGRRLVKLITVLILLMLNSFVMWAQPEVDTLSTDCSYEVSYIINHPTCPNEADGSIELEILNGVGPFTIDWIDGISGNASFQNLLASGSYMIEIIDGDDCSDTLVFDLVDPEPIEFEWTVSPACPGLDNGNINIIPLTGNADTYTIDGGNPQDSTLFENLEPGMHTVRVYDVIGCYYEEEIEIIEMETPDISISKEDVSCPGEEDASLIVIIETVSNADSFYYSLDGDNYLPDSIFNDLDTGLYEVYVRNQNLCVFKDTVEITQPVEPTIEIDATDVTCPDGDDGSFIVIIETVSNPEDYHYSIDGDVYQTDTIFETLTAGIYGLSAQDTTNGCLYTDSIEIVEPEEPTMDVEVDDVTCPDGNDGSFIVIIETVSNSAPYEYSIGGDVYQLDSTFNDLTAGVHEVFIQDTFGCTFSQIIEVEEPEEPTMDVEVDDVTCPDGNDGSFIVIIETVSNSAPYEYSIGGDVYQLDSTFNDLTAGVHEVFIQDTFGCTFSELIEVEEPEMPEIEFNVTDVTCPDGEDASFIVIIETVSNSAPYSYSIGGDIYQTDSTFNNLTADVYDVFVQDTFGCVFNEPVPVDEPDAPLINFDIEDVTCPDGSDGSIIVIIGAESDSIDFDYSLNGNEFVPDSIFNGLQSGLHTVLIRNPQLCIFEESVPIIEPEVPDLDYEITDVTCAGGMDASLIVIIETVSNSEPYLYSIDGGNYIPDSVFNDLEAGIYDVSVKDIFGCVTTDIVAIEEPDEVEMILSTDDISCNGENDGTISIAASGPDGTFTYSLDGTNFQNDSIFNNLGPGVYEVTVKNGVGCIISDNALVVEPDLPEYSVTINDVSCQGGNDGSIEVGIISGLEPFEFALDTNTYQTSNLFENLLAGAYTLYLKDDSGCVISTAADLSEPPPLNSESSSENETCDYANGWIAVAVEGGTSPYIYEWNTGDASPSLANLPEGTYYLSVTDAKSCLLTDSIIIENEPAPELEPILFHLNCFEDGNGSIGLDITSQSPPFMYEWSNGSESSEIDELNAGSYSVTVTDRNNCHSSSEFVLEQPDDIFITGNVVAYEHIGSIDATVAGGVPPYSYNWSNGRTTEDLTNIPFGIYTLSVTDANGCEKIQEFRLFDPELPIDGSVNVYPTVTLDNVNVDIQLPEAKPVNIYLIDELGRLVQVYDPSLVDSQVISIDMEELAAAVYFLRIDIDGEYIIKKVVKVLE